MLDVNKSNVLFFSLYILFIKTILSFCHILNQLDSRISKTMDVNSTSTYFSETSPIYTNSDVMSDVNNTRLRPMKVDSFISMIDPSSFFLFYSQIYQCKQQHNLHILFLALVIFSWMTRNKIPNIHLQTSIRKAMLFFLFSWLSTRFYRTSDRIFQNTSKHPRVISLLIWRIFRIISFFFMQNFGHTLNPCPYLVLTRSISDRMQPSRTSSFNPRKSHRPFGWSTFYHSFRDVLIWVIFTAIQICSMYHSVLY